MTDEKEEIGTVISTLDSPSPSAVDFVVNKGKVHRGQFVEIPSSEGTMVALVNNVFKTNRYFERADSVKEFESNGSALFEQFPTAEWEYLVAKTRLLGVFAKDGLTKRPTLPPSPGARVKIAANPSLEKFLNFDMEAGLHLGEIEHHSLPVKLNLSSLFKKHLAILALSGAGKCVSPSTKVLLSTGEEVEIGPFVDEKLSAGFDVEDGVEFCRNDNPNLRVFSIDNNNKLVKSKIKAFCRRKAPKKMLRVETLTGKSIELTLEHQVPVLDEGIQWLQAAKLKEGDCLFLPKPFISGSEQTIRLCHISKRNKFRKKIRVDTEFARLLAYFLAEGHNNGRMLSFTNNSKLIRADFSHLCFKILGVKPKRIKRENELRVYNKGLALALQDIGFTNSSWTKFVPVELFKSKKQVIASFLSGLIDCDGYISRNRGLELCFASRKLAEAANSMLLQLGLVPLQKEKRVKGKKYARLFVRVSKELRILEKHLNLLIGYKKRNLLECSQRRSNTNIDVIPNINKTIRRLIGLLNMTLPQTNSAGILNYMFRKDNPSFESLERLVNSFEKRILSLELKIKESRELFYSLPNFSERDAQQIVSEAYGQFDFNQIAKGSGISSTTARRLVRGITAPEKSAFALANNVLSLQGERDVGIETINELSFSMLAGKIKRLCSAMGFETQKLCIESLLHKNYLYQAAEGAGGKYSLLYSLLKRLFIKVLPLERNIALAKQDVCFLKSLTTSNLFFDRIKKIESFKPDFTHVYDLSVENRNFVANHLIIHNSYLVSVLLEELLERKKEQGRIATVVLDPHGEYSSFAEPPRSKEHKDYSTKTKLIRARDIQIGVPKLSVGIVSGIIPGLSSPQKRDLSRLISKLKGEMRRGTGPFDLNDLRDAISSDESIKENSKPPLIGWIDSLREMRLFGKTDNPSISDLIKPGQLTVIDLSDLINLRKKQIIVSYFAQRLFYERRSKRVPPFLLVLEEAHQFIPERAKTETAISRNIMRTIAREGRKFGASLCLVSQRPVQLDTTALSQCNTHIILRITNPYDLKHIGESSEGLDKRSEEMISSLRVGEALIVGEATHYPLFFKVRQRRSQESKHEIALEKAAMQFEEGKEKKDEETEQLL